MVRVERDLSGDRQEEQHGIQKEKQTTKRENARQIVAAERAKEKKTDRNKTYLFTTKTCPNCKLAKEYLKDVDYTVIDAEENMDLAVQYGVMQAPTLVIVAGQSQQKYVNVSNIRKYAEFLNTKM